MSKKSSLSIFALVFVFAGIALAAHLSYFQGFETNTTGWNGATRVESGTNTILSATGDWHAESSGGGLNAQGAFTTWGGYGGIAGCTGSACASQFPESGYVTSIDIYLEPSTGTINETRFDFSSAINTPVGTHRRDFVFNAGFYNDGVAPGTGPRFIIAASNNATRSGANPRFSPTVPYVITADGWYTFQHTFRNNGSGVLAVDLAIKNATGTTLNTWTLSDPTDIINTTVGGNRYGWFALQEFSVLAIDNSSKVDVSEAPVDKEQCKKDGWKHVVNGTGGAFNNQGQCVKFVTTGN